MLLQQVYILNTFLIIFDAVCIISASFTGYYIRRFVLVHSSGTMWNIDFYLLIIATLTIMFIVNYAMGRQQLYSDKMPSSYFSLCWSIFKAVFISFVIFSACIFFLKEFVYSRGFMVLFASFSLLFLVVERIFVMLYLKKIAKKGFHLRQILVIGNRKIAKFITELMNSQLSWGHEVIGRLSEFPEKESSSNYLGTLDDIKMVLRKKTIDEVVFALDGSKSINLPEYLSICHQMGISTRILPALWKEKVGHLLTVEMCQDVPFLTIQVDNFNATGLLYKRMLDIVGAIVGIIIFLIVYPFVAIAIKTESKGPVLFKQKRKGQHGRIFNLYKFRSMSQDAEKRKEELMEANVMKGSMFKIKNDPRITPVGRWLRNTSIDEIPQFINVLKGEMSLVGTRPPTLDEVEKYEFTHLRRISSKPGITGLWQISGRNVINDFDQVIELDCKYLENWRFFDDIKILCKTIVVVLQRKGAI